MAWEVINMQKQIPAAEQKIGNGKRSEFTTRPPLDKDSAATRAYLLLNRGSSTKEKSDDAMHAKKKNERSIEWLQQSYDKKLAEKGEESPETELLWNKLNFMKEISDFMDVQTARFIEIKNALNVQKDNLQKQFDARISAPRLVDALKAYIPWIGGAAVATGMVGVGMWNWFTVKVQGIFPGFDPQNVKEITNFAGLVVLGSWAYLQNHLGRKKKDRLASKCAVKKGEIDEKERGIKESVLRLIAIEYDRLSKEYHFEKQNHDVANASERAEKVRREAQVKYGVDLPYPIFDSTRVDLQAASKNKMANLFSSIKEFFKGFGGRKSGPAEPAESPSPQ